MQGKSMKFQIISSWFCVLQIMTGCAITMAKPDGGVLKEKLGKYLRQEETATILQAQQDQSGAHHVFTPAQSLDYLRNDVDPTVFEWFNTDHIEAGATTCGYLYPKLGSGENEPYPTIKVKFCMRFANQQPASKGTLVAHCGGPGALSDCYMEDVGEKNLEHYNIVTFDQRGMGMSWPTFAHEECTYGATKNSQGEILHLDGINPFKVNPTDPDSIQKYLNQQKQRVVSCWGCETCDFHLPAADGSDKTYHFLEHSGTRQAAEDMNLFRQAIGDEKISIFGVSYGTQIVATYATMFPQHTELFIVDANECPTPDLYHTSYMSAKNTHHRLSYLGYSCSMEENIKPGSCPLDLTDCIDPIFDFVKTNIAQTAVEWKTFSRVFYQNFYTKNTGENFYDTFKDMCDAANTQNEDKFLTAMVPFMSPAVLSESQQRCMPGIFHMMTQLLETVGTPNGNLTSAKKFAYDMLMNPSSRSNTHHHHRKGKRAFIDHETCSEFVSPNVTTHKQAELVYNLWEQKVQPLYHHHGSKRKLSVATTAECSGVTVEGGWKDAFEVKCQDGTIAALNDYPSRTLIDGPAYIQQNLVYGQSMAGSSYDSQHFIDEVQNMHKKFGGSYYGKEAARLFLFWYGMGYYWPKAQPVPPAGDITITGIVSGQLYDPATPYECTQEMKMAFPSATLITSQWVAHGLYASKASVFSDSEQFVLDDSCEYLINDYLERGFVGVHDGYVCGAPLPSPFDF